jgi:hypothetical protein
MSNLSLLWQFCVSHQLSLFMIFSAVVSTLPSPLPGSRWYAWLYNLLHFGAANIAKVFPALRITLPEQKPEQK